jgi:hypothetical protein
MSIVISSTEPGSSIAGRPRPITRRAARRAWGEGHVRFWWTSALAVLVIVAYILAIHINDEIKHRRLLAHGVLLDAIAVKVQGVTASDNANFGVERDHTVEVGFRATMPDGRQIDFAGELPPAPAWIKVNQHVQLRVDPSDPDNFTEAGRPASWVQVTGMSLFILLPIAALLLLAAWWRRGMMLKVWREGEPAQGLVVDVRHPAAAPRSRVVQYSIVGSNDRRLFKLLYPISAGIPEKGQTLELLVLPTRPQDAIVPGLYAENG